MRPYEHDGWYFAQCPDSLQPRKFNKWLIGLQEAQNLVDVCSKRRVAIDGGANVGLWSSVFAAHFEQVHALEPVHENVQIIKLNCKAKNLRVHEMALYNKKGQQAFTVNSSNYANIVKEPSQKEQVFFKTARIDDFNFKHVDLIKLDVDGCEMQALEGAERTIARWHPVLSIEIKLLDRKKLRKKLTDLGYHFVYKTEVDEVWK